MRDRFDVLEAWYLYLCHHHEGQGSEKYRRLCKMEEYFRPRLNLRYENLTDEGKEIYDRLVEEQP